MKSIFILTLIIAFCATVHAQSHGHRFIYDTLADGSLKITYPMEAGTFREVIIPPDELEPSFYSPASNIHSLQHLETINYFVENIFSPDDFGGCLPIDVAFNPTLNKLYFFGGRNIIVIDAITQTKIKELTVSEVADNFYTYPRPSPPYHWMIERGYRHILFNSQLNKVYCVTLGGELVVIDSSNDSIIKIIEPPAFNTLFSTSIMFDSAQNYLYWFVNEYRCDFSSYLRKINCHLDIIEHERTFPYFGIYDVVTTGNKLLATTFSVAPNNPHQIQMFDVNNLSTILQFGRSNLGKMFVNNQILYVDDLIVNKIYRYNLADYFSLYPINVTYQRVLLGAINSNGTHLFLTGMNQNLTSGLMVIDLSSANEVHTVAGPNLAALYYDISHDRVYYGGAHFIKSISGSQNFSQVLHQTNNDNKTTIRLVKAGAETVVSCNITAGTASFFDSQLNWQSAAQLGGNIIFGCYNPVNNKFYFIQSHSDNPESFVTIYNATTLEHIAEIPVGRHLTDIVYNKHTNRVYVSSRDNNAVYVIDGATDQLIPDGTIYTQGRQPKKLFISSTNKIYVSAPFRIFIYDGDNHLLLNTIVTTRWSIAMEESSEAGIVYSLQYASPSVITAINDLTAQKIKNIQLLPGWSLGMRYNTRENRLYVACFDARRILIISGVSIVNTIPVTGNHPLFVEYGIHDGEIYVTVPPNQLLVLKNEQIIKTIEDFWVHWIVYNPKNHI